MGAADVVRALLDAYLAQDRGAAEALVGEGFTFTSPQDDHIDRATWFATCFPTAARASRQDVLDCVEVGEGRVLLRYEYELRETGTVHRNVEHHVVRDGRVVEVEVHFGGPVRT